MGQRRGFPSFPLFSLFSFLTVSLIYPLSPLSPSEQVGGLCKGLAHPPCPYFPVHMRSLCLVKMELEAEEPQQLQDSSCCRGFRWVGRTVDLPPKSLGASKDSESPGPTPTPAEVGSQGRESGICVLELWRLPQLEWSTEALLGKGQLNKELKGKKESNTQTLGEESPQWKELRARVLSVG